MADPFREVLAKLTKESAKEIRKQYIRRIVTQKMLAEQYGVNRATIWRVLNYKAWMNC